MPAGVAALVLLSALMHAGWNVLVKRSNDGQVDTVNFAVASSVLAGFMLPFVPGLDTSCLPWMAASLLVHVAYFITLTETYRYVDLSVAYPLMRGMAPMLVTTLIWLAGEPLSGRQGFGIGLIGVGIAFPAWLSMAQGSQPRRGLIFGVINASTIALYTLLDGKGVRQSGTAIGYTAWLFFFNGWGIFAYTVWLRGSKAVIVRLKAHGCLVVGGAMMSMGSYGIVLWAMTQASIPAVAALRELSVVFAALIGTLWLQERMGNIRIACACLVALGGILIKFQG